MVAEPVPEVAVTVTLEVPAGVPDPPDVPPEFESEEPPPHAATVHKIDSANALLHFMRRRTSIDGWPRTMRVASSSKDANAYSTPVLVFGLVEPPLAAVATAPPLVLTVSVVLAASLEGVTLAGEKLQLAPAGSPEQLKVTDCAKPPLGVTVKLIVALWPAATVKVPLVACSVKSAPPLVSLTVVPSRVVLPTCTSILSSPFTSSASVGPDAARYRP